jgi:hypothetical protein
MAIIGAGGCGHSLVCGKTMALPSAHAGQGGTQGRGNFQLTGAAITPINYGILNLFRRFEFH